MKIRNQMMVELMFIPAALVLVTLGALYATGALHRLETVRHRPAASATDPVAQVVATLETDPVPSSGDAADDPAIWIHPNDPFQSTIIGTDKRGGLAVYSLAGHQLQYLPIGRLNNVDIRYDFSLGGRSVALVTASNRTNDSIVIYRVNSATRMLENVAARTIRTGILAYGACMYHSPLNGKYYVFLNSERGEVEQWELLDDGSGRVDGRKVRVFDVGARTEGCVADDELGHLYLGVEDLGIWKYGAEPDGGTVSTLVDSTGAGGHLTAEVEGLALYYGKNGIGYLIASSQGSDDFVIYRREGDNDYLMTFEIAAGNGIDGVSHTDGIDVVNFNLGPAFPEGVFIAQDHKNDSGNQNYKVVSWRAIADVMKRLQHPRVQSSSF